MSNNGAWPPVFYPFQWQAQQQMAHPGYQGTAVPPWNGPTAMPPFAQPSGSPSGPPAAGSTPASHAFGALASWTSLPEPSSVEMVIVVNFNALLPTPAPNPYLVDARTAKILEAGRETWYNREDVLAQIVAEGCWNETLVDVVQFASTIPNTVIVVQTGRTTEHSAAVDAALASREIKAHMFAHTDPLQAPKSRKHQLIQRLWHFFNKATLVYYETPVSQRESRELSSILQRLATPERPLPILQEVHNPRTYFDPVAERQIFEAVLDSHKLTATVQPDRWVWRLDKYSDIVEALGVAGYDEAIGDYIGRSMDAEGDTPPGPRGTKRELRASRLLVAGSKISVVFENEHTLPVARLKQRVVDGTWPIDFAVPMTLDVSRILSITEETVAPLPTNTAHTAPTLPAWATPQTSAQVSGPSCVQPGPQESKPSECPQQSSSSSEASSSSSESSSESDSSYDGSSSESD